MSARARIPPGRRVYAVGDIHGRVDLLFQLQRLIVQDATTAGGLDLVLVYLGDYVDRGPSSNRVLDRLIEMPLAGLRTIHLQGNHEAMMLDFVAGNPSAVWLMNGGIETLASYGVGLDDGWPAATALGELRTRLRLALPPSHLRFLTGLSLVHMEGDYVFVHAGLRPDRPLELQDAYDLLWIREPFLGRGRDDGLCVVHGHTIAPQPEVLAHRIGVDTGAFFSGRLTCVVLEGADIRFLQT
ncbi:MAG: metallophosphoesterase family protein [Rhodospirillales bacterium]